MAKIKLYTVEADDIQWITDHYHFEQTTHHLTNSMDFKFIEAYDHDDLYEIIADLIVEETNIGHGGFTLNIISEEGLEDAS